MTRTAASRCAAAAGCRHTVLGRVDVDHFPFDSAVQHLPERLRRFEAVPGGNRHPARPRSPANEAVPTVNCRTRSPLSTRASAASRSSPAARRAGRGTHQPARRASAWARAVRPPHPLQCPLKRLPGILLRAEPAALHPSRAAPTDPIPVPPNRSPARSLRLHRKNLTLLCHDGTSPIDNEIEESQPRRAPLG